MRNENCMSLCDVSFAVQHTCDKLLGIKYHRDVLSPIFTEHCSY